MHIASYGRGGIFVNCMIASKVRKMTTNSTFHYRFQHIRQIAFLFISVLFMYNTIMLKAKWDCQIKVFLKWDCQIKVFINFSTNIICDIIIHKTVLKVKICEKYNSAVCC